MVRGLEYESGQLVKYSVSDEHRRYYTVVSPELSGVGDECYEGYESINNHH
jgi:hypothetical protein